MDTERYSIIFSSSTGNTKVLADAVREALPEEKCDYFGITGAEDLQSELIYVGFWTNMGNADNAALEVLAKLRGKKIFLFGTAGFGGSEEYFKSILANAKNAVDASNTIVG